MQPLDRFSGHADLYAQYRIDYPADLYDFILQYVNNRHIAWDCATGNGQVAGALADLFTQVEATDISEKQLAEAVQKPNIHYQLSTAEHTPFADHTFDLITVAQAIHWFDIQAFHQEVRRVAKPGAVLAEWGYGLVQPGSDLAPILIDFYRNRIGPYWDPQRKHIDHAYESLPFPFADAKREQFTATRTWSLERFLNYLRTWSAVRQYIYENESDPVTDLGEQLKQTWGPEEREVRFPIFLRVGKV
ncbi:MULTISPECIES: class I SAM-dependent methyltransferase [unclassified Spirosoma]|uniref:class I SAM-dependent methyltransferase n=1 Tax=unclassified Spirosoma TaxID=2621999 RepID=UPI0009628BD5|nr:MULTISPECIES: class I SAM-dependent methyltransferase [unclassified Spirosoma]MBN8825319.1 class I SAM-dependent methyltransferase [Spirosoma sp.]OJW77510.1 MAG: SAM-dependent methyltransferase [Spirosoma sp. 48-14]